MPHDHHKQCLDDSIVVDTSNGHSRWFGRYRRLSKDYEYVTQTSAAVIRVAMIHLMVRRLARMSRF